MTKTKEKRSSAKRCALDKPHFHGHRERLREKFQSSGPSALADYELVELLLFPVLPRRDTKPIAKALIKRFGSFARAITAPRTLLAETEGVGEAVILQIKLIEATAQRLLRRKVEKQIVLSSWGAVLDYCHANMAFAEKEHFRILFLDKKNALIADEVQQTGTIDHTPVYPREVIKRTLELSATAIILVHNHPSGDPEPSHSDIVMTRNLIDIAKPLGIAIHDHVIVSRSGYISMKGMGFM